MSTLPSSVFQKSCIADNKYLDQFRKSPTGQIKNSHYIFTTAKLFIQ